MCSSVSWWEDITGPLSPPAAQLGEDDGGADGGRLRISTIPTATQWRWERDSADHSMWSAGEEMPRSGRGGPSSHRGDRKEGGAEAPPSCLVVWCSAGHWWWPTEIVRELAANPDDIAAANGEVTGARDDLSVVHSRTAAMSRRRSSNTPVGAGDAGQQLGSADGAFTGSTKLKLFSSVLRETVGGLGVGLVDDRGFDRRAGSAG